MFGMSYFFSGLWHFIIALVSSLALGLLTSENPLLWLSRLEFVIPAMLGSCALFWIPDGLSKKGFMKFLHYPLPDWDVLLLSFASHRHWITHSPILPMICFFVLWNYPHLAQEQLPFRSITVGLGVGVGSHLLWDCIGSRRHRIVIFPHWWALRESASRLYLLTGAAAAFVIALWFASGR